MRILIVEDDEEIRNLISYFLRKENYTIESTGDGLEGLKLIKTFKPDLALLDVMLPNLDGMSIADMIREVPETYGSPKIVMLTAKTEIDDVLKGFKSGADDYIRKPFDPRELVVRINKLLKDQKREKTVFNYKEVVIDMDKHKVTENNEEIELSKKEYDLLVYLIKNEGLVLTRDKILDKIWDSQYYVGDRTVDVYIAKIRDKLKSIAKDIRTVKGVGYKLKENN